jgi:hypothetical protein
VIPSPSKEVQKPPIPPVPIPPPVNVNPPAETPPGTKKKPPCPDGWVPETEEVCSGEVTLVLIDAPTIEIDGVYQFNKEDVEKAIKDFETYLSVVHAINTLGGLATDPTATVAGILLPNVDDATDGASEAAVKGLKALAKKLEKLGQAGEWKVVFPREVFSYKCETTKECRDGDWVVTKKAFTFRDTKQRGTPPVAVYDVQLYRPGNSTVVPGERLQVLRQARTWAINKNAAAWATIKSCRDACQ